MTEETETSATNATDRTSHGGEQGQEQAVSQHSSSSESNNGGNHTSNGENNSNDNGESRFVVNDAVTKKFGLGSKVTVFALKKAIFTKSDIVAQAVSSSRPMDFVGKVVRYVNGRNALDVGIPLNISKKSWLAMILVASHFTG